MKHTVNCIPCNCLSCSPISRIRQGQASDDSMFVFNHNKTPQLHYPLHRAMVGTEPSKSELGIKKEMEFKHKSNKN